MTLNGLSARVGGKVVLRDVNLSVKSAGWLAVVGSSGAGKSTLLRMILGLRRPACPTSGVMTFDGVARDLTKPAPGRPADISLVPQSPAHGLDPLRRLGWQWAQLARLKLGSAGQTDQHTALFNALGLPGPANQWPHQWSRGMQQRLLLAMALIDTPKLLVLDEPTSALDPIIAAQVLSEVQRITSAAGISVMMVTHDLAMASRFSNDVAIMEAGRVVEAGPTDQILANPTHAATQDLVSHRHWARAPRLPLVAE
ncbi:ABC transporter ATP-binding protein [Actibacterium sp. 188UL27-1]|nr:ABC transporter ATP-binding protein [Actibacterium sp. 188UL27-1]